MMEFVEFGIIIIMAITTGIQHNIRMEVNDIGSCGRSSG